MTGTDPVTDGGGDDPTVGSDGGSNGPPAGLDAGTLLGEDAELFESFLSGETGGPLAVLGPPFAGRGRVLDAATERLGARRVRLEPTGPDESTAASADPTGPVATTADGRDAVGALTAALGDDPLVVEGCQHLYERRIGGFDRLKTFLGALASVETPVVTGWNRYAWAYLDAVQDLGAAFPVTVETGPVVADALADLLLERYGDPPAFAADEGDTGRVAVRRYPVGWGERTVSVPVPVPAGWGRRSRSEPDPADLVFERLAAVSEGNVGVAAALWDRSRADTVRPSDVGRPVDDLDLDRDAAFCLRVVLAKERVRRAELAAVVGGDLDRILGRLRRAGAVTREGDLVALDPAAVPTAARATERERIL